MLVGQWQFTLKPIPDSMNRRKRTLFFILIAEALIGAAALARIEPGVYAQMARGLGWDPRPKVEHIYDGPNVGEPAPSFSLEDRVSRRTVSLADLRGKPVVLLFGSLSCLFFQSAAPEIDKLRASFGDRVQVLIVYTQENHGVDHIIPGRTGSEQFKFTCTMAERKANADLAVSRKRLAVRMLIDGIDNKTAEAYAATSARLFVLDATGRVLYKGAKPFVHSDEALRVLTDRLRISPVAKIAQARY